MIGRSNTGTHLRTHWRSAAFHLKYAGDYFPLLLCILSASDIVLLLGLHLIYIPSLLTTTQLRRQTEIYSYRALAHVTCEEHERRTASRCAKTSQRWPRTAGINNTDQTESSNANKRHYSLIVRSRGTNKLDSGVHV